MGVYIKGISNATIVVPSSLTQYQIPLCDEVTKNACYKMTGPGRAIAIPVVNIDVEKVASGVPPGAGSFVAFQPFYVAARVGDTLYIIPPVLNQNEWEYYAPVNADEVYIVFIAIDATYKEHTFVTDKSLNTVISNAVLYVEIADGILLVPDLPIIPILIIAAASFVGGLAAWGWVEHAEAEKIQAENQRVIAYAQAQLMTAMAQKIQQTASVEEAVKAAEAANATLTITTLPAVRPQDNGNDWFSKLFNFLKQNLLPIVGLLGAIFVLMKLSIFVNIIRDLLKTLRE